MNLRQRFIIPIEQERLWALLVDVERAGRCIPGVTSLSGRGDGSYQGAISVKVGPFSLNLEGHLRLTLVDGERRRATMEAEAADRRLGGGLRSAMSIELEELGPHETALAIETQARLLGRLGELGQPIIRRKAQAILEEFARNLQRAATHSTP